jgi:hypothetical protein
VKLTFTERLSILPTVAVKDPSGAVVNAGPATLDGSVVTQPVKAGIAGRYTVDWKATAQDGDKSKGSFAFTLAGATPSAGASGSPGADASADATADAAAGASSVGTSGTARADAAKADDSARAWWVWVLPIVVIVALIGSVVVVRRRRG